MADFVHAVAPPPGQIRRFREERNLSRAAAAALIYKSERTWEKWEQGLSPMDPAYWELFVTKCS